MDYLKLEISVSNVENIVEQLSRDWRGNESWLNELALKLNDQNKNLRDDLRKNKNSWTYNQYKIRVAYHYYEISALFNKLYIKYKLDVHSIIKWLKKCLGQLGEVPPDYLTSKVAKLKSDAEEYLVKSNNLHEALKARIAKLKTQQGEEYVSTCAALGDISGNAAVLAWLSTCKTNERDFWFKKLQNLIITRVIAFLEDSFTHRNRRYPLVTSNLLRSLGNAYNTVGIQFLGERYQNTGQGLLKSVLESSTTDKDRKQNLKNIIAQCIMDGTSLNDVYHTIEETYSQTLSVTDQAYVSTKYIMICFKQYIEETVALLKDEVNGNKDRQTMNEILESLRCSNTLLQIQYPLDQSFRYKLMTDNYSYLLKGDERKLMEILKKESFAVMVDYVNASKKELHFLETLVGFLGMTKDIRYLENKLNLHQVCNQDAPLSTIIKGVLDLDVEEFGGDLRDVQAAAAPLKDEETLFYEDKFRDFIIEYFKPPKIRMVELDGRNVLEVSGMKLVLSDINREDPFTELLTNKSCTEVRFIGGKSVHVDDSFNDSNWSGLNIVVYSEMIRVHNEVVWDVSGKASSKVCTTDAGRHSDGTGKQGRDGEAGESGGNVLILVNQLLSPEKWILRSSGGKGSDGQNGGDGVDGQDGKGITKSDFEKKFPPVSKFLAIERYRNLRTTLENIRSLGTITFKWYERTRSNPLLLIPGTSYCFENNFDSIMEDLNPTLDSITNVVNPVIYPIRSPRIVVFTGNIFTRAVTNDGNELEFSFQTNQSYFLFKGAPGKPGSKGGAPGLGGQGGFGGEVRLRNPNNPMISFDVVVETIPGTDGQSGKGGRHGRHGKNGCDMGYLDYIVTDFFASTWPKWYGEGENSKIELTYHVSESSDRVWSPYRSYKNYAEKYVGMSGSGLDNHKSRQSNMRMTLNQNQQRGSDAKATKKKTISQANIISQYQHLLGSNETASILQLFSQIDETNEELIQSIAHTMKSKCEVSTKAEFTRCTVYRKNTKSGFHEKAEPKLQQPRRDIKPKLVESLKGQPMPVVGWAALSTMHLTKAEITLLGPIFDSSYSAEDSAKIKAIRTMFLEKYRFATLGEIAKMLSHDDYTVHTENLGPTEIAKYLGVGDEDTNSFSHPDLGTLNQYLLINQPQEREKIIDFIKNVNYIEKDLVVFRSFVLALGNSSSASEELKSCFENYDYFLQKEVAGLIVFTESLSRIDLKNSKNEEISNDVLRFIREEGCLTSPCILLMARIFNVNIRLYKERCGAYKTFYLEHSYDPILHNTWNQNQVVHLLIRSGKLSPMMVNREYIKLDRKGKIMERQCEKILRETGKLGNWEELDQYLASQELSIRSFSDYFEDDDDSTTSVCLNEGEKDHIICEIIKQFDDLDDQALLGDRLSKLSNWIPGNIMESMRKKFSFEGRSVSALELSYLINSILVSVAEGNAFRHIYEWIILAYPQDQWIDQVLLMDLETHFKKSLPSEIKGKWANYISKIKNKSILLRFSEKLELISDLDVECVEEIFFILSEISVEFEPGELGLAEWPCALKEKYWSHKLGEIREWEDVVELSTHSYYLLSIENNHGAQLVQDLLESLLRRKNQLTSELLSTILSSFYNDAWDLSDKELREFEASEDVSSWVEWMKRRFLVDGKERDIVRLCELLESNANTSHSVKTMLPDIRNLLEVTTKDSDFNSYNFVKADKPIVDYNESDIAGWLKAFSGALKNAKDDINEVKSHSKDIWIEMLAVVDTAIHLKRGFRLRDTQKLAVMILIKNKNSALAQVATGEGKSLIVVALSIMKALIGGKIDIITSSSVLAKRDAENNQDLYKMFEINVSHNCSEDIESRKEAYSGNQVVYGDLSDFQRDYLLHEFYNINVLGDRAFQTVVVDEVDSMLLDKGNNVLYLSHNIPGLDKLESLYLFIWQWISRPCGARNDILESMDAKSIRDAVMYDLYGTITVDDIKTLEVKMSDSRAREIWRKLKKNNIVDELSRIKTEKLNKSTIGQMLSPNLSVYTDRLCYLINECIFRDRQIHVPNFLLPFVDIHLDKWIHNAINAFFMKNGEDYVVDVDRTGTSSDRHPNITIIDKDTGTDQSNSQWDEALHQFLQLKHGCKVSSLSLKAVFISNVSYFKEYDHLYGLTGTLGSQGERKLLKEVHTVDFVTIPTARPKQFCEFVPKICYSDAEWKNNIKTEALDLIKKDRSVLIICQSVNDVENLHQVFGGKGANNVHTYARDYEEFDVAQSKQELGPGHIVIATNLAGRGTDIKINAGLKNAGGLHVIVAYLPKNTRIEQQAFGRAARCGEKGSGQLIIPINYTKQSRILNLKNQRDNDELERISEIKSFYENQIKVEEMCFDKFKKQFNEIKRSIIQANAQSSLSESVRKLDIEDTNVSMVDAATSAVPKIVEDILLKSCINKWAFWLDRNGKLVSDWKNLSSQNSLESSLDKFLCQMKDIKFDHQQSWADWLDGNPVSMIELAKYFLQNKSHDLAIALLDKVIAEETHFSEGAHYYMAAAFGSKIDWESEPSTYDSNVVAMNAELMMAEKLFERLSRTAMTNAALIGKMKHENQHSLIQVDAYEEQQKNIANLCRFFSVSISDIIGHSVTPESFYSWNISDRIANTLYKLLIQDEILTQPRVAMKNLSNMDLETISCSYDVSSSDLSSFLREHDGKHIVSFKSFKNDLKKKIKLPSKEAFWKELVKSQIFQNEIKYVVVDRDKLAQIDPSLLDDFSFYSSDERKLERGDNQIFLNAEQLKEQETNTYVFEKGALKNRVGQKRYAALKEKKVLAFNRRCDFNLDSLRSAADSRPTKFTIEDFNSNVDASESESLIEQFCKSEVISRTESPEKFCVLVPSNFIDGLSTASEKLKEFLKTYSGGPRFQLEHYDSISVSDLTRNRLTEGDSQSVLNELEQIKVIEKSLETDSYRLTTHYTTIDRTTLSTPVYENVTKSVIKMAFSYRIALQKMVSLLEQGESARILLQTKPHMDFFWSLYDSKAIIPSQVSTGVTKEAVEKILTPLKERRLANILGSSGCLSNADIDGLITNLVSSEWLISLPESAYRVEKDKQKRKPLDQRYSFCQKTVAKLVDELADLSDETTVAIIAQSVDRMKSMLRALDVPSFGLKPISEAISEGDFSMIQELTCFMTSGLGDLIVLKEKAYTFKFWVNVTCVVLLGVCQILIGAIIDINSVGAFTHLGNAFISEGISDIMYAIGAMRTGYFSWKDYGRHKIESVALTIVTAGVGAFWSKGTKFSRVGQKLDPGLVSSKLTQTTGAEILKRANESIAKEIAKTVALKTIEAVVFGVANSAIDTAVNNYLQGLSKGIASQILAEIEQEVQNHSITSSLERAFKIKGESNARIMVQELTELYFTKTTEWQTMCSWASKIFSSVLRGIIDGTAKKQNAGLQTTRTDAVFQLIVKFTAVVNYAAEIMEIRYMTKRMLDGLAREIDSKLEGNQERASEAFDETRFARFKADIVNGWRNEIKKRSGDIIGQHIISPLLKDGAHALLRRAGRLVKYYYRKFKEHKYYQEVLDRKRQYQEDIERSGDDVEAREGITQKYCDTLLKLAAETRDPQVYALILDEGVQMDITCLHPLTAVLSRILQARGIEDGVKIQVEKDDVNQTFQVGGTTGETIVIRLRITDNHYELLDDAGLEIPLPPEVGGRGSNNCLIRAIAHKINLGMSEREIRHLMADTIRNDTCIQNIIKQGYHRYGILFGLHGGRAHPYEKPGCWEFDDKKDIDLLNYRYENGEKIPITKELSNEELNEHLQKAYNKTLEKINEIVTGKSQIQGWKNVKLVSSPITPDDFAPTMYDTIYITGGFGLVRKAYYPVEMETIISVKQGENVIKYIVEMDIDALTRVQNGPQGPHIGYKITLYRPEGEYKVPKAECPKSVAGHCTISTTGNEEVPRRALMSEKAPGVKFVPGRKYQDVPDSKLPKDTDEQGRNIYHVPPKRLFYGSTRIGSRLQRAVDDKGQASTTRGRSFPSYDVY